MSIAHVKYRSLQCMSSFYSGGLYCITVMTSTIWSTSRNFGTLEGRAMRRSSLVPQMLPLHEREFVYNIPGWMMHCASILRHHENANVGRLFKKSKMPEVVIDGSYSTRHADNFRILA
jgi:hypothetical protein